MRRVPGYTAIEVMIVLAMMAVLVTIASPFFVQWRNDLNSRRETRGVYDALRQARSRSISSNYQHMVSFEPAGARFRMVRGSRAYNTPPAEWENAEWVVLPRGVTLKSGADGSSTASVAVQFNADGTARLQTPMGTDLPPAAVVTVCLQGGNSRKNFISVSNCGRIALQ